MELSSIKVEQISSKSEVVIDFGESLSVSEIREIALNSFPNTTFSNGSILGRYDKTDFCLYFKNISYLGNPHPVYKKRIQTWRIQ